MRFLYSALVLLLVWSCSRSEQGNPSNQIDTVPFQKNVIQDSIIGIPNYAKSPVASYQAEILVPNTEDSKLNQFLDHAIRIGLIGDSLAGQYQNIEALVQKQKGLFFDDYRLTMSEGLEEGWIDTTDFLASFNYEEVIHMRIEHNEKGILTLAYESYSYTGGAHGNYGTALQSIDVHKGQILQWEDIFTIKQDNKDLSSMLNATARSYFELEQGDELGNYLFVDQIEANNNFGLSKEGMLFIYVPYEIAPYAAGEIKLLIPYDKMKDMIRPEYRS